MPLIVNQPGRVPARQISNLVYFPDFMPTLARLAGSSHAVPTDNNGMDISPLFYGSDIDTDSRDLYWEFPGKQRAIRHGGWKCVTVKKDAPLELYRIKDDPCEQHDVAAEHPEVVRELDRLMRQMRRPSVNYPIPEDNK